MQQTSLNAYRQEVRPTLGERQRQVLAVFESTDRDYTNSELAGILGWSINRVTPRVFELRKLHKVEESHKRTCHITGRTAIAWRLRKIIDEYETLLPLQPSPPINFEVILQEIGGFGHSCNKYKYH